MAKRAAKGKRKSEGPAKDSKRSATGPRNRPRRRVPLPGSADFVTKAHDAVRPILAASTPLAEFLAAAPALTAAERLQLVEQAMVLLEGFYVHLPLKRAMHAVDPLQRLRLLRKRLPEIDSDVRFHSEMTRVFTSLRDLHTNYLLPAVPGQLFASLPFRVEAWGEKSARHYIVGGVATGFDHASFKPGVELRHWNGVPIERAVEIAADKHAGSNLEARRARGIAGLTQRPLRVVAPPDEEWVIVGYEASDGSVQEVRLDWLVTALPPDIPGEGPDPAMAFAMGLDLETDLVQSARRMLFAPQVEEAEALIAAASAGDAVLGEMGEFESTMPKVFKAERVETKHGAFGHIRIWTFKVDKPDDFVAEFVRLVEVLPKNGLIVDVRDNGGGVIYAGEQLLQVLTPRHIEPERLQFINTPSTQRLCEQNAPGPLVDLKPWLASIKRAVETGATFSAGFAISSEDKCNAIGQRYYGPVVLITSARCYSTTDIFAAGFQDHEIGKILGVDANTGAGGANVWGHGLLRQLLSGADSPIKPLPKGADMRVAIRRTLRVGAQSGTELEDLGVEPDEPHAITKDDILKGNVDLLNRAGELLSKLPVYALAVEPAKGAGGTLSLKVGFKNIDRLDVYLDDRPRASKATPAGADKMTIDLDDAQGVSAVLVQGFEKGKLVACRRLST